jgi:uncharacterized protein GlcG (DUF336 family)
MSVSLSEALGYIDRGIEKATEMDVNVALVMVDEVPNGVVRAIDGVMNFKVVTLAGGVPIFDGGELLGAVMLRQAQHEDSGELAVRPSS